MNNEELKNKKTKLLKDLNELINEFYRETGFGVVLETEVVEIGVEEGSRKTLVKSLTVNF